MPIGFRTPLTLTGRYVELVPLSLDYLDALVTAGADSAIWEFVRVGDVREPSVMRRWVERLLEEQRDGGTLAFAQVERSSRRTIGMTRFLTIDRDADRVEVGGTWLPPRYWRTPYNTDAKRLLLGHAFEVEGCHRVEFKTDLRNIRSQRAIERLGATREGIDREHLLLPDGHWRTSVRYGILDTEWPAVRERLDALLARPWNGPTG